MRTASTYLWPLFLITVGLTILIKNVFHLNFSTGRVTVGLVIVFIGLSVFFGGHGIRNEGNLIFSNGDISASEMEREYNIIFSNGTVDLSRIDVDSGMKRVKVNSIFSSGTVRIDRNTPVVIKIDSAFGKANAPDGTSISFGEHTYRTEGAKQKDAYLEIEASVVFGKLDIIEE